MYIDTMSLCRKRLDSDTNLHLCNSPCRCVKDYCLQHGMISSKRIRFGDSCRESNAPIWKSRKFSYKDPNLDRILREQRWNGKGLPVLNLGVRLERTTSRVSLLLLLSWSPCRAASICASRNTCGFKRVLLNLSTGPGYFGVLRNFGFGVLRHTMIGLPTIKYDWVFAWEHSEPQPQYSSSRK
jgi:hypothetical protein